jgi:hypothetical protein
MQALAAELSGYAGIFRCFLTRTRMCSLSLHLFCLIVAGYTGFEVG